MPQAADAPNTYAKAGGPPDEWRQLFVYLDGSPLKGVIEVNADEGWAVVVVTDPAGHVLRNETGDGPRTMRLTELKGRLTIAPGEAEPPTTASPEATHGDHAGA